MADALTVVAGLLGGLAVVMGAFLIFTSIEDGKTTPRITRRRLGALLGLLLVMMGVSFLASFYTGGLTTHIRTGGNRWVVNLALWARWGGSGLALGLIVYSLVVWRRKG